MGLQFRDKMKTINWKAVISVEPVMIFYYLARGIGQPADKGLWYVKVCVDEYSDYVCENLQHENYTEAEEWVQKSASRWELFESLCMVIPSVIFILIYGSWSDRYSRKFPIILPIIGAIVHDVWYMVNAIFLHAPPGMLLPGVIVNGLCGGVTSVLAGCFSYLSELSNKDNRTVRISIVYAFVMASSSVAYFISGLILDNTGFIFVYSLTASLNVIGIIYVVVWLRDFRPQSSSADKPADSMHIDLPSVCTAAGDMNTDDHSVATDDRQRIIPDEISQATENTPAASSPAKNCPVHEAGTSSTDSKDVASGCCETISDAEESSPSDQYAIVDTETANQKETCYEKTKKLFGLHHLKESFLILAEKRPPHVQVHLNVLLLLIFYIITVSGG